MKARIGTSVTALALLGVGALREQICAAGSSELW